MKWNTMNIDVDLMKHQLSRKSNAYSTTVGRNRVVKIDTFFFQHELKITERVKTIRYYQIWFDILQKHIPLKIGEMDHMILYQHEIHYEEQERVFLCEYPSDRKRCDLIDFLSNLPSEKLIIFHLFDSFKHLLNSIDILSRNNLAFLSISPEDIVIGEHLKPMLRNFDKCCFLDQPNQIWRESIYNPFELRVVCFLTNNKCVSLSITNIEDICNGYSPEYVDYLRKFINQPSAAIVKTLTSNSKTWSKCSLALVYLQLIDEISGVFSLKYKFIDEFINILHQMTRVVHRLSDTHEIQTQLKFMDFTSFS